jgi:hypothetical protein
LGLPGIEAFHSVQVSGSISGPELMPDSIVVMLENLSLMNQSPRSKAYGNLDRTTTNLGVEHPLPDAM